MKVLNEESEVLVLIVFKVIVFGVFILIALMILLIFLINIKEILANLKEERKDIILNILAGIFIFSLIIVLLQGV